MRSLRSAKIIAYLAVIFVAGGAAGAVITMQNQRERQARPASLEKTCNRFQDRLVSKLGLTPDQIQTLQPVFDQAARELRAVHARALCDTDGIIGKAHQQIARELTPEQQIRLEALDRERHDWLRRRVKERPSHQKRPSH